MEEFEQKAIQLIYVTPEGKYQMNPHAQLFLQKIPKPLAIISVAGLYRTGKSYLLNRILLNRNNGFGVGPTINPCTKGLWCWGVPIKGTTSQDSQGIGALDQDQNHDIKIFTLAILTSSVFIYNSVGSIDQTALQNLSLVVNLTKNIQLNTENNDEEDPEELARYFPTFFWVVRDFSLQLISSQGEILTPKDYLQRALAPQKGFSDDIQQKNRIRRLLTAFFKDRECSTLVRPLVNQQKLQHLYDCSFQELRPQFVEQALNLRKKVLTNAKPKMIKGEYLDGNMYVSMVHSYLKAINNGGVPNIQNAWTYMCIEKCMKLQESCYDFFVEETEKVIKDSLPCSVSQFQSEIQSIQSQCLKRFEQEQIGEQSKSYLKELKTKIRQRINQLKLQNQKESINLLKNYIIKNFSVIEKKMKMNQFQTFQEYLKSINNFYVYLVDNGPDLPKKEVVYLDFLKKVTTQGAEIFIKQINQNLQTYKNLTNQKEKFMKKENQELKNKVKIDLQKYKQKMTTILTQKQQFQQKSKVFEQKYQHIKLTSQTELTKLETSYQNKLKIIDIKLGQTTFSLQEIKQKKQSLQTSYILQRKQRQKQKAILQLKMNQMKDQLKSLKIKEKNQQIFINQLQVQSSSRFKQTNLQNQKKMKEISQELYRMKETYNQVVENKEDLQNKLRVLERQALISNKKLQNQLRIQIQKLQTYKTQIQTQKSSKITSLQSQLHLLQQNLFQTSTLKQQYQQQSKDLKQKLKTTSSQNEKQIAILTQKIQFLTHQTLESKQKINKSFEYYEGMLKSQNQVRQEELRKLYKNQFNQMEQEYQFKIKKLEGEMLSLKDKYQQQCNSLIKMQENYKFTYELQNKRYQNQIKNQLITIQNLQQQKHKLYSQKQTIQKQMQQKLTLKQTYYQQKLTLLQKQLQISTQKAFQQHSQINNKSEQSLKQLKNYYQLQKQNLQHRIYNDRQKYDKKLNKLRDEYELQLQQQRKVSQEQYQNLKDQYNNQVSMLKELIINLQHQNDSKTKNQQNLQIRYEELKERLEKKEQEFNHKIQMLNKMYSQERQVLQQKIMDVTDQKSKLQKEIIIINHQKDQSFKESKDITSKYQIKIQQIFYLNKNLQKINAQNRQKINDLNNEYMNQRLNYQKKIALAQQQKQFYFKKIQDYQKQQTKNALALEQLSKKLTNDYQQQLKLLQTKKNSQYTTLQSKYEKLKKSSKQQQQQTTRKLNESQKQLALQRQKSNNLLQKYQQLEQKRSNDGSYLSNQLIHTKQSLIKLNKDYSQETNRLKKQLNDVSNEKNQIVVLYQRDKILLENKNNYLQETKEKNKKEYLQKIKNLQTTIENINKNRINDKNYFETNQNQNIAKIEKKYQTIVQQNHQNWSKKQRQYDITIKQLQFDLRNSNQKSSSQHQMMAQTIKTQQRRLKQLQQNQKRATNQLQKYKNFKQTSSTQNLTLFQRQKQSLKLKLQQKQQKYKTLQKTKQQIYYNFQKQKARWNLQKENYLMKHDELKETITKHQKDMQKLSRQNQKLKAQKKCNKMNNLSSFSRYSGTSKYNLEDSISNINLSTSKQNCNPLGELSFFNNQ